MVFLVLDDPVTKVYNISLKIESAPYQDALIRFMLINTVQTLLGRQLYIERLGKEESNSNILEACTHEFQALGHRGIPPNADPKTEAAYPLLTWWMIAVALISIMDNHHATETRSYANGIMGTPVQKPYIAGVVNVLVQLSAMGLCVRILSLFRLSVDPLGKSGWLIAITALRTAAIRDWSKVPLVSWSRHESSHLLKSAAETEVVVLAIQLETLIMITASAILQFSGWELESDQAACDAGTIICLAGYALNKHLLRMDHPPRLKSKMYIFNIFLALPFPACGLVGFFFRLSLLKDNQCYIVIRNGLLIIPITGEFLVNSYFTLLFFMRLASSHSIRGLLKRAALGSVITLVVTMAYGSLSFAITRNLLLTYRRNLSALFATNGEAAWLCLLSCELDALINALVLAWVMPKDNVSTAFNKTPQIHVSGGSDAPSHPESTPVPVLQTHGLAVV
ncbi:hypothetical protein BX600DRAFT_441668 [Xylariales sp. PMI_506]|nr:hypothetical protein BX600DRAFT_441668 [Xylariales sp. PMI_506]